MTRYKIIFELEVEEIQGQTQEQVLEQFAIVPGNYIENAKIVNKRIWEMKPKFSVICRFGGFCTNKELYEDCIQDERIKNNWMCWRDGINKNSQSSSGSAKK